MRLRGKDRTGGARLSILIYTQIIALVCSSPFSLFLCCFPWKMRCQIKPSASNCSIFSAVACHLSVLLVQLSNVNSQLTLLHWATFLPSQPLYPLIWHLSLSPYCLSFYLSIYVPPSLSLPPSFPLSGLQAEVLYSQRRNTGLSDGLVNGVTDNSAN